MWLRAPTPEVSSRLRVAKCTQTAPSRRAEVPGQGAPNEGAGGAVGLRGAPDLRRAQRTQEEDARVDAVFLLFSPKNDAPPSPRPRALRLDPAPVAW